MPGLPYTGIARNTRTTLTKAATAIGGHHLPGISRRPAKPNATHNGANTASCSTTPTAAHTTIRMMITGGFSQTSTAPYPPITRPTPIKDHPHGGHGTTSILDSHFVCSTPGLVGAISRQG